MTETEARSYPAQDKPIYIEDDHPYSGLIEEE